MHLRRKPTPPGEILQEEFLKPLGITQKELADHIGCDLKVINRIINEKTSITPAMAAKLGAALETSPDFWLSAQMALDLWSSRTKTKKISSLLRIKRRRRRATF